MNLLLATLKTLMIAALGGSLFFYAHTPLPWMLGSIAAIILWTTATKQTLRWPQEITFAGQILIGYTIGRTFTPATGQEIIGQLPVMLAATIATVGFSLILGYITHKQTGISLSTGLLGSIPGGMSQIATLCSEIPKTDITVVTFMQTARLLSVIFVVPFLAVHGLAGGVTSGSVVSAAETARYAALPHWYGGAVGLCTLAATWLAWRLRLPTPFLLGPILGTAGLVLSGLQAPPVDKPYLDFAQLCIGAYTGCRIKLSNLKNWRKLLPYTGVAVVLLIIFSLLIGYFLQRWHDISLITAFLSTAPGGMAEMGLTAMLLQADLSVIVAFQLFRLLFILLIVPPFLTWWLKKRPLANNCG